MVAKLPMYTILMVFSVIGAYVPALLGQSLFGGWAIVGVLLGGIVGTMIYYKLHQNGYIN